MRRIGLLAVGAAIAFTVALGAGHISADEYEVIPGDTLSEIAYRHGMTVEELARANGIVDPDLILSGQVLMIPGSPVAPPAPEGPSGGGGAYTVRLGDTLSDIAVQFGVPEAAIIEANGIADPNFILAGQTLVIPAVESALVAPVNPEIEALLDEVALAEGLDAGLLKALAYVESGWQQGVVSSTGAVGVMQIQPSTGYWLERDVFGFDLNIEGSAYDNIRVGARLLRLLMDLTDNEDQALAAYYQGYGSLRIGVLYEDTVRYVADVKAIRDLFWPS